MSITEEIGLSVDRFKTHSEELIALLKRHNVDSLSKLTRAIRSNDAFSRDWKAIWQKVAEADGGKLSLTTLGVVFGSVLGGVGIAAMGGAIGLPLAIVLGLSGLLAGAEIDSVRSFKNSKTKMLRIPKSLLARIEVAAKLQGVSVNEMILQSLDSSFPAELIEPAKKY